MPSPVFRSRLLDDSEEGGKKRVAAEDEGERVGRKAVDSSVEGGGGSSSKMPEVKRKDPRRERELSSDMLDQGETNKSLANEEVQHLREGSVMKGRNKGVEEDLVLRSEGSSRSSQSQTGDDLILRREGPKRTEISDLNLGKEKDLVLRSKGPCRSEMLDSGEVEDGEGLPIQGSQRNERGSSGEKGELILKSSGPSRVQAKNFPVGSNSGSLLGEDELCLMLEESDVPTPSQTPVSDRSDEDGDSPEEEGEEREEEDEANQSLDDLFGKVIADMEKDLSDLPDMFTDEDVDEQAKNESRRSNAESEEFISSMSQPLLAAARRKSREAAIADSPKKDKKTKKKRSVDDGEKRKQEKEKEKREAEILKEILREKKRKSREIRARGVMQDVFGESPPAKGAEEKGEKEKSEAEISKNAIVSIEEDVVNRGREVKRSKDDKKTRKKNSKEMAEGERAGGKLVELEEEEMRRAGSSKSGQGGASGDREGVIRELEEWGEREARREEVVGGGRAGESRVGEAGSSRSPGRSKSATEAALEMLQKSPHSLCCPRFVKYSHHESNITTYFSGSAPSVGQDEGELGAGQ